MQLVAYGAQDVYLTGNPQITFFKVVYRRTTNFSVEAIEVPFDSARFGGRNTIQVLRNGDLATQVYVKVTLPELTTVGQGYKVAWTRRIGHVLMNNIEVTIGGSQIDKHYGLWLDIWYELTHTEEQTRGYDNMIGNVPELTVLNTYIPQYTLYVPLQFWFNRNTGLALPLIALQYHEVRFNVEFSRLEDVLNAQGGTIAECGCFGNNNFNQNFVDASILVNYVYLDQEERRRMAQVGHEYLIEQVQFNGTESISSANNRVKLDFNHPSKELVWVLQSSLFTQHKRFLTYNPGLVDSTSTANTVAILDNANKNLALGLVATGTQPVDSNGATWVSPVGLSGTLDGSGVPAQSVGIVNWILPSSGGDDCYCPCPNVQNDVVVTAVVTNDSTTTWTGQDLWVNSGLSFGVSTPKYVDLAHKLKDIHYIINIDANGVVTVDDVTIVDSDLNIADASTPVDTVVDNRSALGQALDVLVTQPLNYGADLAGTGIMVSVAKIQLNGHDRFDEQPGEYFNYVQPWECHTHTPVDGVYVYSFALHPEQHQPSGSANLSRIDSTYLYLQLIDPFRPVNTSPYSTTYAYETYNVPDCQQYRSIPVEVVKDSLLWVFDFNYNVLRVMSGMGGLAYAN